MRVFGFAAAVAAVTSLAGPVTAQEQVQIVVEGTYPPWNSQTADGELTGFDVELAGMVCEEAGLDCAVTAQPWDSQIPSLIEGKFDAMMTVGPTPTRLEVIDFSTPYAATPATFGVAADGDLNPLPGTGETVKGDDPAAASVMDPLREVLQGRVIGVVGSSSLQNFLDANMSDGIEIRAYKSTPDAVLDLRSGRVDAVFDSSAFLNGAVQNPDNAHMVVTGPRLTADTLATDVAFGLHKGDAELKSKLDGAIATLQESGAIADLSDKWFGFDVSP